VRRLACALVLSLAAGAAAAAERVLDFRSEIAIGADGVLTVRETIAVQAEGRQIRNGFYRDFPTDYAGRFGQRVHVTFDVVLVSLDGARVPWIRQRLANGVRVTIGDPHTLLRPGRHEYALTYRATRELGFFPDHDELYWNVTGNGWYFPIDHVFADVTLPAPVPALALAAEAYTGPAGARGRDYTSDLRNGGASFETTRGLAPHEGMSIVLGFPKGIVREPGAWQQAAWWLSDNRGAALGAAGALLLLVFLYWRWSAVGRDPRAGPKFPRYEPPPGMGAADVRFVDRMGYDDKCLAAALLGLGARGYLRVAKTLDGYTVQRTGSEVEWLPGERQLASMLLGPADTIALERKHDPAVQAARDAFRANLELEYNNRMFSRNLGPFSLGLMIAFATFAAMISLDTPVPLLFALAAAMVIELVLFRFLLPAYTPAGRKVQDQIEGLRYYLGVAEQDELRRLKAPEQTPEEFAKFLPYALALGVEKTWADRFAAALGAAAVTAAVAHYYVAGHRGGPFGGGDSVGSFADSLGALGGTVSAAATPPGSSSGASGGSGGGSGGGGGGGGGGGW
jgi:Predicted membrane protein (DUF2207) C-terminal domain/Predicted membrane protein (DUF2207) N-terminal domain